jgi:hypothetical protein
MVEQQNGTELQIDITPEDLRTAMQTSPLLAAQVRNHALVRTIRELQAELVKFKAAYIDLATPEPVANKEAGNADSEG